MSPVKELSTILNFLLPEDSSLLQWLEGKVDGVFSVHGSFRMSDGLPESSEEGRASHLGVG